MNEPTLLDVIRQRFGVDVDPDSDGGQILNSLIPKPPFDDVALVGQAAVAALTFSPTSSGVSVRAAQAADALVFNVPIGQYQFTLVPPDGAHPAPQVELQLLTFTVPVPFLRPAQKEADNTLTATAGKVELHFTDLLLVITASSAPPASAKLAPGHNAAGEQKVTMTPPFALIGPGTVLGLGFDRAILKLDGPGEAEISAPDIEIFVAPPGVLALAMHGGGHDLRLGLGVGGLSGDFLVALADGAQAASRPRFLHNMGAHLRLNRSSITLLELTGQIDLPGEIDARLGALGDPPGKIDYVLGLVLDDGWQAALTLTAAGERDYLWRTLRPVPNPDVHDLKRDTLGAYAVFTPLLAPNLPDPGGSGYVALALGAGAAGALAASQSVSTQSVTLHGGELVVRSSGETSEAFLLFDLETELDFKLMVGGTKLLATRRPLKVRHKAIGLRLDFGPDGGAPQLMPIFDPAQGFSLDLSDPGMFEVPPPLGDIVQPEGARMARENPLTFEIDLVIKADLGVVTVDRASVRIPLDSAASPTITALGAHVNVPAALSGDGYLKLLPNGGFAGSLDVSLTPLGIRLAAGLAVEPTHDDATNENLVGVLVTLGVELPVPIPLGTSGLGFFGFLGLFGMHFQRNQSSSQTALQWFIDENRAHGDATRLEAWKAAAHNWALGLGAVIGTVEGGFMIHAKGMVVIELPGPRLLLVMNADILSLPPGIRGAKTGNILAVIEISDISITIGLVLEYKIEPLLAFRIPVEAFFHFKETENWHLDIGGNGIDPHLLPASVKFLFQFRADGYLMIHGDFINFTHERKLNGFAVAAGIRAAFIWGPEPIGLYLKITAQADLGISFKPALIIGKMTLSGELHLFIVSVEVSASADVTIASGTPETPGTFFITAKVCGSVDFFFFEVEGCVTLELGDKPTKLPKAEPLVRALSLHSRSPALLPGSAGDRPVDGSLGDAFHLDSNGQFVGINPDARIPVVPIDAIPVLQMEMRPSVDPGCKFFDKSIDSKLPPNGWQRRGERFYRYTLKSVDLAGTAVGGGPLPSAVDEGETPNVWWDRRGKPGGGDDNDVQLALLSWIPDPTPAAAERSKHLDERVTRRWGDMCAEVAAPAAVLWTFRQSPGGPSASGWRLLGTAWPDVPGTTRSALPADQLRVVEPWRSADPLGNGLAQVAPAYVSATLSLPDRLLVAPRTGLELRPAVVNDDRFAKLFSTLRPQGLDGLADAVRLDTAGLRAVRLLLFVHVDVRDGRLLVLRALDAGGGSTGFEQTIDPASSREIVGLGDLPPEWSDPAGPWLPLAEGVRNAWFQVFVEPFSEGPLVLFEAELPPGTTQVEIGLVDDIRLVEIGLADDIRLEIPNWGLLAVEGQTEAEFLRFSFDNETRQRSITVVDGALNADQSKRALLRPNAIYTVDLTYDVDVTEADDKGNPKEKETVPTAGLNQQFQFQTDAQPPDRLDPWVFATDPGPGQNFFFFGDPLRVVFSTNATRKLFKAYGRELFAVAKAASGKHPPAGPGVDAAQVNLAATLTEPHGIAAIVVTPFESALRSVVAGHDCVEVDVVAPRHELVTLQMKLEPSTDYILDLEARPAASDPSYPMFRRHFSTSRYESMATLAADVLSAPVQGRRVANPAALTALAAENPGSPVLQVSDSVFEAVLREARWGDLARPSQPRLTVIWQEVAGGALPQPLALLIETSEPLWRWRDVPTEVTDGEGVRRFQLQPQGWLEVIETSAGAPLAARFVHSTDGARTLVALKPAARGGTLSLALRRNHHLLFEGSLPAELVTLVSASLAAAPWEDQL